MRYSCCLIGCILFNLYAPVHIVSIANRINSMAEPYTTKIDAALRDENYHFCIYTYKPPMSADASTTPAALQPDTSRFVFWINDGTLWYSKTSGMLFYTAKTDTSSIPVYGTVTVGALLQNLDPELNYWITITLTPAGPRAYDLTDNKKSIENLSALTS